MKHRLKNRGFSLTEVLLALGALTIGMICVAGVFPVGLHFSTIATERTVAAVVADEAFAKIRLFAQHRDFPLDANDFLPDRSARFEQVVQAMYGAVGAIDPNEFLYPSTRRDRAEKQYLWSAICRRDGLRGVQITVFVYRRLNAAAQYWARTDRDNAALWQAPSPVPVYVSVDSGADYELVINDLVPADAIDEVSFINDGCTIVDDVTGEMYRVTERNDNVALLDKLWRGALQGQVWAVPAPVDGGRYPCIAVYQKVVRF
ncbi:MAG: type IV pilus modification PilV family protein [Planctomycetota bacterium]|jgi:hypothetical protein